MFRLIKPLFTVAFCVSSSLPAIKTLLESPATNAFTSFLSPSSAKINSFASPCNSIFTISSLPIESISIRFSLPIVPTLKMTYSPSMRDLFVPSPSLFDDPICDILKMPALPIWSK